MRAQAAIGGLMAASLRHRAAILAVAALLTIGSVAVLLLVEPDIETDVQAGTFPLDDPQANAFRALREDVAGINSELVYLELKPDARAPDGTPVTAVQQREASLAVEELFTYVQARYVEETGRQDVVAYTGYPYLLKLVYSYLPQGSFAVPVEQDYATVQQILTATDQGSLDFYFSDDNRSTIFSILYEPGTDKDATAGLINELVAEYREMPAKAGTAKTYDLWQERYLDAWGIQSWIYRIDEQVGKDLRVLVPLVLVALALVMRAAFRNWRAALLGLGLVGMVQLWTLAAMTLLDLPIGFVSMALFPLILGVGDDYVVHIVGDVAIARQRGRSLAQAVRESGLTSGVSLVVATLTTLSGFTVILFSGSPMIVQVCVATLIGITLMLVASLVILPGMLPWFRVPDGPVRQRSPALMAGVAATVSRNRAAVAVVLLVATAALVPLAKQTEYAIATVQNNLPSRPEPSQMLVMYDRFQHKMEATGQESFIHQGDMGDPAVMDGLVRTHLAMEAEPFFGAALSLPFVVDLYEALEGGELGRVGPLATVPEAILGQVSLPEQAPPVAPERFQRVRDLDEAELRASLDGLWADERWNPLARSFLDEGRSITWTFSFIGIEADASATREADAAMRSILERAGPQPADTHYFGTLTALKRINDQAKEWLALSAVADILVLVGLVAIVTRNLRAVVTVGLIVGLSMLWWLALLNLPGVDLQLSFVYLIPLAFVTSLGTDYAVHLTLTVHEAGPGGRAGAYRSVGRIIAYSFLTTAAAFLIFTFGAIKGSWQMFQACVLALAVTTVLTLLIVPLLFPVKPTDKPLAWSRRGPPRAGPVR